MISEPEYIPRIPKETPSGKVLCHNHIRHGARTRPGTNGFRAWLANRPPQGFIPCQCGWAAEAGLHYASEHYL